MMDHQTWKHQLWNHHDNDASGFSSNSDGDEDERHDEVVVVVSDEVHHLSWWGPEARSQRMSYRTISTYMHQS
jgi:Rad3-related DNA helicase